MNLRKLNNEMVYVEFIGRRGSNRQSVQSYHGKKYGFVKDNDYKEYIPYGLYLSLQKHLKTQFKIVSEKQKEDKKPESSIEVVEKVSEYTSEEVTDSPLTELYTKKNKKK